jgi:pyruvate/2-oxoglutarate dehydrogenase complex dihydrolipoamide acyltransferase (E2) component
MRRPVVMPDLGTPAVLSVWFADPGDAVYAGDRLVEVLAGGATFDVTSPVTGRLTEKCAYPEDPLSPGQVLGMVDEEDEALT